jgi:hypothetical protein
MKTNSRSNRISLRVLLWYQFASSIHGKSGAARSFLVPPPLRSASSEDSHRFKFTLQISDKLHEKNFHLWWQLMRAISPSTLFALALLLSSWTMKLVAPVRSILHTRYGGIMTRCSFLGFNRRFPVSFCRVLLEAFMCMSLGIVSSTTFRNRLVLMCVISGLSFMQLFFRTLQSKSIFFEFDKPLMP